MKPKFWLLRSESGKQSSVLAGKPLNSISPLSPSSLPIIRYVTSNVLMQHARHRANEIDRRTLLRNDPRADQVHFIGDQNDRHLAAGLVVMYLVQKVDGQFVRLPVLHRIHDDDGSDVIAVVVVVLKLE